MRGDGRAARLQVSMNYHSIRKGRLEEMEGDLACLVDGNYCTYTYGAVRRQGHEDTGSHV